MITALQKLSLKAKLIIGTCIIALGGMAVTGVLSYGMSSRIVMAMAENELMGRITALAPVIDITYNENLARQKAAAERVMTSLEARLAVNDSLKVEVEAEDQVSHEKTKLSIPTLLVDGRPLNDHSIVERMAEENFSAVTLFVVTEKGLLRRSTSLKKADGSRAVGTYIPTSSPVYEAVMSGKPYFGRAKVLGQDFVTAYIPIVRNGATKAVVFSGSPESAPSEIKKYLASQKIHGAGYFYVMDSKAVLLEHPKLEGKSLYDVPDADGRFFAREMIQMKTGKIEYNWKKSPDAAPARKIAMFQYFPTLDWYVAASVDLDDLYEDVHALRKVILGVTAVMMIVMVLAVGFMSNKLINLLIEMSSRLRTYADAMGDQSETINRLSEQLSSGSQGQAAALEQTASALQEVSTTIQKNLESTHMSEEISLESKQAATLGRDVVDRMAQAVGEVQRANETAQSDVKDSYNRIREVSLLVKSIEEKTKVINDIVFQTRLLSFNASVEAARAGEHGKGFAVVAEEISNLAAMSGAAARDIDTTIGGSVRQVEDLIQTSQGRIMTSFEGSAKAVDDCVTIAEEGKRVLDQVLENSVRAHSAMQEITVASNEQAKAIEEISKAIHQIESATRTNSGLSHESAGVAHEIENQAHLLHDATNELNEMVRGKSSKDVPFHEHFQTPGSGPESGSEFERTAA